MGYLVPYSVTFYDYTTWNKGAIRDSKIYLFGCRGADSYVMQIGVFMKGAVFRSMFTETDSWLQYNGYYYYYYYYCTNCIIQTSAPLV